MRHDLATLIRFYRWNAPIYDLTRWTILRRRGEAAAALNLTPGDRVLDIGCGTGLSFRHLRRRLGDTGRIVGVDLSEAMLARAARRREAGANLICAEASQLHLGCEFDAVLMAFSLTMIPDWQTALARACGQLSTGGRIVILDFGRPERRLAPFRSTFHKYLQANHVHPERDLRSELESHVGTVEMLRPSGALLTMLRGVR